VKIKGEREYLNLSTTMLGPCPKDLLCNFFSLQIIQEGDITSKVFFFLKPELLFCFSAS
jgi:hypothetical protein